MIDSSQHTSTITCIAAPRVWHFSAFHCMLQRWAHAYCDSVYHAAINTNNGTEAQNKLFKYNFLATNRGQLSLQSQLYLLKTTCQRPIKSTCCKTISKHLRTEHTMTLCLNTSGTDPETSFRIVLTGWQEATSSQPVTLLTMIWRREYLKL